MLLHELTLGLPLPLPLLVSCNGYIYICIIASIMEASETNYDSNSNAVDIDSSSSYKLRKEQFVFGLEGTTPHELLFICSTTFMGMFLYYLYCDSPQFAPNIPPRSVNVRQIAGEVVCFFIPMILCQTMWIYPYGIIYMSIELLLSLLVLYQKICAHTSNTNRITSDEVSEESTELSMQQLQRVTITIYRGCILVLTIISILGIDFHIYPRRFGKTEITGYSLMDLGAASFIIMAAISSSAKRHTQPPSEQRATTSTENQSVLSGPSKRPSFHKQIQKMAPLLIMGTIRLITHKGIEYPEHNSEYGVHWNFFYTLAFVIPAAPLIKSSIYANNQLHWILPISIFILYQYLLSFHNLQDFIVYAPRTCPISTTTGTWSILARIACDIWYANREGMVGCLAFTALYLICDYIACTYFWNYDKKVCIREASNEKCNIQVWETTKRLWFTVIALLATWQLLIAPPMFNLLISRRSTNVVFCVWVLFVNLFQFVSIHTIVLLCYKLTTKPPRFSLQLQAPLILASFNRNGLYIFIIANLLTGIINLSIDTLSVSNHVAIGILLLYVSIVGIIGILLDHLRSRIPSRTSSQSIKVVKVE